MYGKNGKYTGIKSWLNSLREHLMILLVDSQMAYGIPRKPAAPAEPR